MAKKRGRGRPPVEVSRGRLPWRKFFPRDFLSDPALLGCSLASVGLWIKTLCLIWEQDNGKGSISMSITALARAAGTRRVELVELLEELAGAGVAEIEFTRPVTKSTEAVDKPVGKGGNGGISDAFVTKVTAGEIYTVTIKSRRIAREAETRSGSRDRMRKMRGKLRDVTKLLGD